MNDEQIFKSLVNEIRVNNAVVVIGAGVSFEPGMPLCSQLAPLIWEVVDCFPDIDSMFKGTGSTKDRIGEDFENFKKAFAYIEKNEAALSEFKRMFKKLNDKITVAPEIHKNISKLIHEKFFELIVSFNWDSLLEMSWSELYGTHINASKTNVIKPHGDALEFETNWTLPNSPGRISEKEKDYINLLAKERPRTLIIVGYSENDAEIVKQLISPLENKWKVYRVSPFSTKRETIHYSAKKFFERLVEELINPDIYEDWEFLNFQNQNKSIARAILGYKLTPQDVAICPELPQVQKAIKILGLNNFVIIQGKPGSGKSISCYQIAYFYLKQGYEVLRFKTENFIDKENLSLPPNSRAVYIIDDGQVLPNSLLLNLQEKSSENQKVILTVTDDIDVDSALVSISNFENIECISKFYMKNKSIVSNIIANIDTNVGDYFMQESFENRIKVASKEENLWTFNYVLRGSWKSTKDDYYQAKELDNSQRLIFLLSLKQIITKDDVVDIEWIKQKVNVYFAKDIGWVEQKIENLRKRRLIDPSNIRMIHYEAAKRQLLYIFENDKENMREYEDIIRHEILSNNNPIIGKVWFMNAIFTSSIKYRIPYIISTDEFYKLIEEGLSLNNKNVTEYTLFFIDALTRFTNQQYFDIYHFSSWIVEEIENVTDDTAYALSKVMNELYNSDRKRAKELGKGINLEKITYRVSHLNKNHLYQWSQFISRLGLLLNKETKDEFIESLDKIKIEKELLSLEYSNLDFEELVEFIVTIFCYNEVYGTKVFHLMTENFRIAFKQNSINAWHTLGFNFIALVMGFNSLSDKRDYIKKNQRNIVEKIISFIDAKQLAEELVAAPFRNWHNLSELYRILRKIDPKKYAVLVESVDLSRLKNKFDENNVWEDFYIHSEINEFLYLYLDKKYIPIIDQFIFDNKEKIIKKNLFLFSFSPSLIKYYIEEKIDIPMYGSKYSKEKFEWQAFEIIIYILLGKDDCLLRSFLLNKSKDIAGAIVGFDMIYLDSINRFLQILKDFDEGIFNTIHEHIDMNTLNKKVHQSYNSRMFPAKELIDTKQKLSLLFEQLKFEKI
ncbi:nSTAND3 domain-containing NTPase [Bacillus cereus]|uniref:nSTAND3 domain-containing NTPase n=1 Tax=Bacillus cereus TaxID=1396 RepID=UPI0018F35CB2|nr:hypothetical protein [Bacillus cereus]MBJ7966977.1 hypothetical protein [Bacillus cereus]MBJ8003374.1 hypothetical protein [Bacillus cereus]